MTSASILRVINQRTLSLSFLTSLLLSRTVTAYPLLLSSSSIAETILA